MNLVILCNQDRSEAELMYLFLIICRICVEKRLIECTARTYLALGFSFDTNPMIELCMVSRGRGELYPRSRNGGIEIIQMVVHVVRWLTEEWPNLYDKSPHNDAASSGINLKKTYLSSVTKDNTLKLGRPGIDS